MATFPYPSTSAEYEETDLSDDLDYRAAKRAKPSVARQACEACRSRKTRCDQDRPCGLCKSHEIECVYMERKPTRNEASLSMIFSRLKRIESKIDQTKVAQEAAKNTHAVPPLLQTSPQAEFALFTTPPQLSDLHRTISTTGSTSGERDRDRDTRLSFSAHQAVHWPGLHSGLHAVESFVSFPPSADGSGAYLADIELETPAFPEDIHSADFPEHWLESLSLSTVKGLSNAYFNTFNRIFPFLDRDYYFTNTLSSVVGQGFNYDIDSCLVLSTMALGCLGAKAFDEGGYHNEDKLPSTETIRNLMAQDVPGKALFIESQRRIGVCSCAKDIEISQYYLTAALFYSQAMRPVHQWMMTDRASTNCLLFWNHLRSRSDEWTIDMQSRVFWSALLMEAVIVQELDLPRSRLRELEEVVPLPKFIQYPTTKRSHSSRKDDSYFSYHFLAQVAHRIILTRIRDEMYHLNPSITVANELKHQLNQWLTNLPPALRFDEEIATFSCPAEAYATSLLKTRFRSAIYHLGRPFLYKALANPSSVIDQELTFCSEALQVASNWPIATGPCRKMGSFSPLKYLVSCSFFGTLLISHALKQSGDERLMKTLPESSDTCCAYMMQHIEELAPMSPTLQKDYELLSMLYHPANH